MVGAGLLHLVVPKPYIAIIPKALPASWARGLVYASGVAEIAGGLALLPRRSRRAAAWFIGALLVAVFPANVEMALDRPGVLTIARLPLQAPLIWWALRIARHPRAAAAHDVPASTVPPRLPRHR